MKIRMICTGKTDDPQIKTMLGGFSDRITRYCNFSVIEVPTPRKTASSGENKVRSAESAAILKLIRTGDFLVLLDEHGKEMDSPEFAGFLNHRFLSGTKGLVFIIGGAFGVDEVLKKKAGFILSLSRMTFPHQLVRILFAEQLYRALTILRNEPYHHE